MTTTNFVRVFVFALLTACPSPAQQQPGGVSTLPPSSSGGGGATGPQGAPGPGYSATSATSQTVGTGSTTFTTQSGLAYAGGSLSYAVVCSSGAPTACFFGTVTSYSGSTLVVNATTTSGSGTHTDWLISVSGATGAAGPSGPSGATGATGATGANGTPTDIGSLTYNASGTTTFAAASGATVGATVTTTHSTSTTLSPTGLVKWGTYILTILQDATGGGVTFNLGTGGSCSAWKITGGGSGAISLSTAANAQDELVFTFDGTNCRGTLLPNQN